MTTWAITGATGLLGSNLLWELLKNHQDDFDSVRVVVLGRSDETGSLRRRIERAFANDGVHYVFGGNAKNGARAALERIVCIDADLRAASLGIDARSLASLRHTGIDHFVHVAALTDFRDSTEVRANLSEINHLGTHRVTELIDDLGGVGEVVFVGSAYSAGLVDGLITPTFEQPADSFRNPYERTKLLAEQWMREFCERRAIPIRVFRPTTIAGRVIEPPIGFVTKFDVFYSWCAFFLRLRCRLNPRGYNWDEPLEIPIRIACASDAGLNIVAADFAAKVMWHAVSGKSEHHTMHIASYAELPHREYVALMFDKLNITGWEFVDTIPMRKNQFERLYYRSVGGIFTPYVVQRPMCFDVVALADVCRRAGIAPCNIGLPEFERMIDFARDRYFGCTDVAPRELPPETPSTGAPD
jgi:nucleoside-diphosphate-sugar epimerase